MRSVFEAAKIGICSLSIRGEIVEVNEAALETLGGTYNDALGQQLGDVFKCVNCMPYGCGRSDKCKFCIIRNNIEAAVLDDGFSAEFVAAVISRVTEEVIDTVLGFAAESGFYIKNLEYSPIKGPEGNIEYLVYIRKETAGGCDSSVDVRTVVEAAHGELDK